VHGCDSEPRLGHVPDPAAAAAARRFLVHGDGSARPGVQRGRRRLRRDSLGRYGEPRGGLLSRMLIERPLSGPEGRLPRIGEQWH
jgi:hypothetical protein